jgi:hypothetical protein
LKEKASIEDQGGSFGRSAPKCSRGGQKAKLVLPPILNSAKDICDLQEILKQRDEKLAEAQKAQAELIRKQRELDDAKRELDLTVEKKIQEGLSAARQQAQREAEEHLKLKVMEKEQTITSMQKQIEELKRRAEQGSQQLQGEVQELVLEDLLKAKFPYDTIEPVPKGEHGRCCIGFGSIGQSCGTILCIQTHQELGDGWLSKLRDDQRTARQKSQCSSARPSRRGGDI